MKKTIILILALIGNHLFSQDLKIDKIEPPNWWANHSYNEVQLMVYGQNLTDLNVKTTDPNIQIVDITNGRSSNYAFVNIKLNKKTSSGQYEFEFSNQFGEEEIKYPILQREDPQNLHQGFSNDDVIYLIFPDRFVNGDPDNDFINNEKDKFEFGSLNGRHGGDIQGIIDKLDYLKDLGITAIWSTPLTENDMFMSYHGYAVTDMYNIDPRHGTNELYKELVTKAHDRGIKVILDHVANHIGIEHEWIDDLPTKSWLNGSPSDHLPAEHNKTAYVDIHAHNSSITNANLGWFVDEMPDLNQTDPILAKYIIQNTIWWIEYSGIDGIREDTYPYANQKFMSQWAKEILSHYPNFNIVGEVWKGEPAILAAFQTNSYFPKEFDSNLPSVTDFAFRDAVFDYLGGKANLNTIYETLGKDFVYADPNNLLVFFDNHDTDRGMYAANWDLQKFKVGLTLVLTTRGIPQLFYGTEIGLDGGGHHGRIRGEFPGGFSVEESNAFMQSGRTDEQNEIFNFTKSLLNLRKKYSVLRNGDLIQFQPRNNVYLYFKENEEDRIMIVINDNQFDVKISTKNISEDKNKKLLLTNILNSKEIEIEPNSLMNIPAQSISIYKIY